MKIALLCSGLGNIARGHEVFAKDLFALLQNDVDISLFKGGGDSGHKEHVIPNLERLSPLLDGLHVLASPKWAAATRERERERIEAITFAHAALKPLLSGGYDIIHCLEREVCETLFAHRHLFARTPKFLFSNGGAIPRARLPPCDFVQEHTEFNLSRSDRNKAFFIPHGVDCKRFHPNIKSDFRHRYGIPEDAIVAISVGTICYWHKRMDYVIRELAPVKDIYLIIAGQESADSAEIKALAHQKMTNRVIFVTLSHDELPKAYAAADFFVLGSLFETFGIAYIEAMAMGLPVISTNHPNQKAIIKDGLFIEMKKPGALTAAVKGLNQEQLRHYRRRGPEIVRENYDLQLLRDRYICEYKRISMTPTHVPQWSLKHRVRTNIVNALRSFRLL